MKSLFCSLVLTIFALQFLYTETTHADTAVIPSPSKTQRSSHQTPVAAAWTDRSRWNVSGEFVDGEFKDDGNKTSEEEEQNLGISVFRRFNPQMVLEATLTFGKEEDKDLTGPSDDDETTSRTVEVNFGLNLSPTFAFGVQIQNSHEVIEDDTFGDFRDKGRSMNLFAGLKRDDLYFMGGVEMNKSEFDGFKDDSEVLLLGVGRVAGELSTEAVLRYQNEDGDKSTRIDTTAFLNKMNVQHSLNAIYARITDDDSTKFYRILYGADIDLSGFYVFPSLSVSLNDLKGGKIINATPNFEAGVRTDTCTYYGNLSYSATEIKPDSGTDSEINELSLTVGANFDF